MTNLRHPVSRRKAYRYVVLTAIAAVGLSAALGAPGTGKGRLSRDLKALELVAGTEGGVDVIISYETHPGAERRTELERMGATHRRNLSLVRAVAARVPVSQLRQVAARAGVRSIVLDDPISASTDVAVPAVGGHLAREVFGLDGAGVRVAVIDSGVEPLPGLGATPEAPDGRLVAWVDLVDPQRSRPGDPFGHGTHVAGIIAGAETELVDPGRQRTFGGVAPAAEIVSVRVLDREGNGRVSDAIAGIDWVVRNAQELNIRIINLSLGHPVRDPAAYDPLVQACERAWEAGLLVVVSGGNLGRETPAYGTVTSPGNSAVVLTVGALVDAETASRSDDTVASYSSRGPTIFDGIVKPDLLAPGDGLVSLRSPLSFLDRHFPENRVGSTSRGAKAAEFFRLSGTSMAAAMASGAAALLLAQDPDLGPDDLKARLMRSAEKRPEGIYAQGAGTLDLMQALETEGWVDTSRSASSLRDDLAVQLVQDAPWSLDAGWGLEDVYGPAALWDASTVWDLEEIWADDEGTAEVVWQVPTPSPPETERVWRRLPDPASQSVVWQLVESPMRGRPGPADEVDSDSVVWQLRPAKGGAAEDALTGESVVWQGRPSKKAHPLQPSDDFLSSESVVWQGKPTVIGGHPSLTTDWVSAESVVWQGQRTGLQILIQGDGDRRP
jgi:serine protease AprX